MARIFLSYAREDEPQVRDVYRHLREAGFEVWMDKISLLPGQRWQQEIPRAIRNSNFILIFFSKNSVAKQGYVQREFRLALDTLEEMPPDAIHTIPIRLDDCQIPEQFRHLQWSDLSEAGEFDRIVQALRWGMEQRQTVAPEPALEPPPNPIPDRARTFSRSEGRSDAEAPVQPTQEPESTAASQPEKPPVPDQPPRQVSVGRFKKTTIGIMVICFLGLGLAFYGLWPVKVKKPVGEAACYDEAAVNSLVVRLQKTSEAYNRGLISGIDFTERRRKLFDDLHHLMAQGPSTEACISQELVLVMSLYNNGYIDSFQWGNSRMILSKALHDLLLAKVQSEEDRLQALAVIKQLYDQGAIDGSQLATTRAALIGK